MAGRTLYDKIWDDHLVSNNEDGTSLIYIDRHLVHEVTSPQAFEGLRMNGRKEVLRLKNQRRRRLRWRCRPSLLRRGVATEGARGRPRPQDPAGRSVRMTAPPKSPRRPYRESAGR